LWWSNVATKYPHFYFSCSDSFNFSLIIQKNKKHAKNKNTKNLFHNKPWSQIKWPLYFLFFHKSNIAIYINHILSHFSFNIKNTNKYSFAVHLPLWLSFILKHFFKTNKKHKNKSNVNFYPEVRGFDPSRVRRQRTLVLPNQ